MFVENGPFGGRLRDDGSISPIFAARVVIPESEFRRLGLGGYERYSRLPACFRWCHDKFGIGGSRWVPELQDPSVNYIYFEQFQDAISFLACWGNEAMMVPAATSPARRRSATITRH